MSNITCHLCDFTHSQEPKFYRHLAEKHNLADPEQAYNDIHNAGKRPMCQCKPDCDRPVAWAGWKKGHLSKYVRGHNAGVQGAGAFLNQEVQKRAAQKRIQGFAQGKYKVWNDGLTKETDQRVAETSEKIGATINEGYATGRIRDWRLSQPEKAKEQAKKMSETRKRLFSQGHLKTWNKGLTRGIDSRVRQSAENISIHYDEREAGRRLKTDELLARVMAFDGFQLLTPITDYRRKYGQQLSFRCLKGDHEFTKTLSAMEGCPKCPTCNPKASKGQLELFEFVKSLDPSAVLSDRTAIAPMEIDVLVPGKLGIEFNGLWWHSDRFLDDGYATRKMRAADAVGLPLVGFFEDEWRDKRSIVQAMIRHRLGSCSRIGARECRVVMLDTATRRAFMDANHLDGDCLASAAWGLEHRGVLVAALSVRRPFHVSHKDYIEVARFCLSPDIAVVGALSRLSRQALRWAHEKKKAGLMTYVDRRIGNARGYLASGFSLQRETGNRFFWTDFYDRFDRFSVRADRTRNMTEAAVAAEAGVCKIWSCPNVLLTLTAVH